MENTEIRDEKLWKLAKKRAAFKRHLISYILVNSFLWILWGLSNHSWDYFGNDSSFHFRHIGFDFPWPMLVTFFWGIGLLFDFIHTYVGHKDNLVEKEYQKLLNKK